jgi:hypothetical protein
MLTSAVPLKNSYLFPKRFPENALGPDPTIAPLKESAKKWGSERDAGSNEVGSIQALPLRWVQFLPRFFPDSIITCNTLA